MEPLILGLIIGGITLLLIIGIGVLFLFKRSSKNKKKSKSTKDADKGHLIKAQIVDDNKHDKESKPGKEKLDIECPGCAHSFKIKSGVGKIKCPECGLEGEL